MRIDRRRKLPATVLIRALGAVPDTAKKNPIEFQRHHRGDPQLLLRHRDHLPALGERVREVGGARAAPRPARHPRHQDQVRRGDRQEEPQVHPRGDQEARGGEDAHAAHRRRTSSSPRSPPTTWWTRRTGEVILECNEEVSQEKVDELLKRGIKEFKVLFIDNLNVGPYLRETLMLDKIDSPEQAIMEIYRRLRPGDPPTPETATNLFTNLFFNPERYDLSKVGRLKLNFKFGLEEPLDGQILTKRDILEVIRYLIDLKNGKRDHRRHRPPRQPPRPRGGRAAREPVPHRPGPDGAGDQGAHESSGNRDADAARPDQRQAGHGGDQGVLRVVAAVAVHGPDQPPVRGDAQAAPLGPRAPAV